MEPYKALKTLTYLFHYILLQKYFVVGLDIRVAKVNE